jgi:beta-1,4-galactosyltransferase
MLKNRLRVYVVSLRDSTRRNLIIEQFLKLNIDFTFVDAVNGKLLGPDEISAINNNVAVTQRYKRQIGVGEIGCTLSHQNIYMDIVNDNIDYAIIFEDDIKLSESLHEVINYFNDVESSNLDRNLYVLGGQEGLPSQDMLVVSERSKIMISNSLYFNKLNFSSRYIYRTCCYAISKNVAMNLNSVFNRSFYIADDWHYLFSQRVFDAIYFCNVANHPEDLGGSLIENERENTSSQWRRSSVREFLRKCKIFARQVLRYY